MSNEFVKQQRTGLFPSSHCGELQMDEELICEKYPVNAEDENLFIIGGCEHCGGSIINGEDTVFCGNCGYTWIKERKK